MNNIEKDTIRNMALRASELWPDNTALVFDSTGEEYTFFEFDQKTNQLANFLISEYGIKKESKVALMLPNVGAYPLFWVSLAKIGAITVPLNPGYKEDDARHLLLHSEACLIITTDDKIPLIDNIQKECGTLKNVIRLDGKGRNDQIDQILEKYNSGAIEEPLDSQTITNIQYTSGTTGLPKGCLLPNRYWDEYAGVVGASLEPNLGVDDVILTAQPFSYIDPQWNLVAALSTGAKLVVLARFRPSLFWEKISEYGVTFFYCLGAMPSLMLKMPEAAVDRDHKVRKVVCSGIPLDKHAELERRYGVPWVEAYGTTETGADIGDWSLSGHEELVGTGCLGMAGPHRVARVIDENGQDVAADAVGQLILKGPGMMQGYYNNGEATDAVLKDGWYHTGDNVRVDQRGRFYFGSRSKDMIRRGGENISAVEVEGVLQMYPDVVIAACLPVPDEVREEEVKAFVVLREGVGELAVVELVKFVESRLARFKVPRYWEFRDSLPMTPSERVRKKELMTADSDSRVYDCVTQSWT